MPKEEGSGVLAALGFDLSKVNIKFVLASVAILYVSAWPFEIYTEGVSSAKEDNIGDLKDQEKTLLGEIARYKNIEEEIKKVGEEKKNLEEKKKALEEKIYNKKNPFRIMVYIGSNIPENLWIEKMSLKEGEIVMEGATSSYRSIGEFIDDLKGSVYFDSSLDFDGAETKIDKQTGMRTENFKISGKVVKYN